MFHINYESKLYREYGLNFINEFIEYANQDIDLIILFEGEIPSDLKITSHKIIN